MIICPGRVRPFPPVPRPLSVSSWPDERRGSVLRPPLAGHCARGQPARALCPDTIIIALMIALEKRLVIGRQGPSSGRPRSSSKASPREWRKFRRRASLEKCKLQSVTNDSAPPSAAGIKAVINRAGCIRAGEGVTGAGARRKRRKENGKKNRGWENSFRGTRRSISDRQGEQLETNYRKK